MSTPAIEKIIEQTRAIVCASHHCENPPPDSVILSLAAQLHLARVSRDLLTKENAELLTALQKECDHEWEKVDASFDHEFGTEVIRYMQCEKCGKQAEPGDIDDPPERDWDIERDRREDNP